MFIVWWCLASRGAFLVLQSSSWPRNERNVVNKSSRSPLPNWRKRRDPRISRWHVTNHSCVEYFSLPVLCQRESSTDSTRSIDDGYSLCPDVRVDFASVTIPVRGSTIYKTAPLLSIVLTCISLSECPRSRSVARIIVDTSSGGLV